MNKPTTLNSAVAIELTAYLRESGTTRRELAEATGMHYTTVGKLLLGQTDIDVRVIALFATVLGFEPRELIDRATRRLSENLAK
jgi:transcriptional regulator with XRE-family HTH domain